jgi:hypothetical protein
VQPAPTSLADAQEALKRAQEGRGEVLAMRPKTRSNVRAARLLLAENHLAARVRASAKDLL